MSCTILIIIIYNDNNAVVHVQFLTVSSNVQQILASLHRKSPQSSNERSNLDLSLVSTFFGNEQLLSIEEHYFDDAISH